VKAFQETYKVEDDNLLITRTADVTDHLTACRELRAEGPETGKFRGEHIMHRVASIPAIVAMEWLKEGINIFDPSPQTMRQIHRKLNGDFKHLKTVDAHL
jgi:hypothetical protein